MKRRLMLTALAIGLLFGAPLGAQDAGGAGTLMVVHSEGAVEKIPSDGDPTLVEIAHELSEADHLRLGTGAVVSLVPLEGEAAGRVVKILGPIEGVVRDLVAKATSATTALAPDLVAALRDPLPETLEGPGITRAAEKGPLRPVYPAGKVAMPCGDFVFVPGVDDLEGGTLEVRVYDRNPDRSEVEPLLRLEAKDSPAKAEAKLLRLAAGTRHWWQVAAILDGEEVMAGESVPFTPVASPVGDALPPAGFESPEARGAWHLVRARRFQKARLYLDAYREYGTLAAAGGGSSAVEKLQKRIRKKLGLDVDDVAAIQRVIGVREAAVDVLRLHDGREFSGEVVKVGATEILFKSRGTQYSVRPDLVKEVVRAEHPRLASAAPFVSVTSKRYAISTNAGKEFGKEAARHLEALFDCFARVLGKDLGARHAKNLKAVIYRDEKDFRAYVQTRSPRQDTAYGWYDPANTTLYLFRYFKGDEELTWRTLYHEGVHQILHIVCNWDPDVSRLPHFWVSEAIPCYMESLVWKGKRLEVGAPNPARVEGFRRLVSGGQMVPLDEFFRLDQSGFGTTELYDQGHAIFWYLMHGNRGKHRKALLKFTRAILQNRPRKSLDVKSFGKPLTEVAAPSQSWFAQEFGK